MEIELGPLSERETYAILTQTILPRPIAWVLTDNSLPGDARWNLAPFSFFNGISSEPPMVMFSVGSWDVPGRVKDSLLKIKERNNKLNQDVDKCIELVKRSKNHAEILHKISKEIPIIDEETKEKMQTMMRTFVNKLDIDHFDRITREVKHRDFFSGLILEAELLNYLHSYEKSRIAYSYVCENLKVIKNHDDLQIILNKLCQSLVKNKCVEFYSYIINNLHIISTFVVPYGVEGWQKTLFLFRDELESIKDSESIKIIDSKISILPPITINKDTKSTMSIKNKPTGYYLVPFENYKMSLYNSSSQEMLNSIIRNASYQCFVNIMNNPNNIILLSEELGLKKWMILGFEIQLHIKNKNI